MAVSLQATWRVAFVLGFCLLIFTSAFARAPRRELPRWELRRLIACAVMLYVVGFIASATGHKLLAGLVLAAGIALSALSAWLSRGRDQHDPPSNAKPVDTEPLPEPEGDPRFYWDMFERGLRTYDTSWSLGEHERRSQRSRERI